MIEVKDISKTYNGTKVVDIPNMTIRDGECLGLVGNNGAGKTTFFRLVLDLIEATTGEITIDGEKAARNDAWKTFVGSFLDESFLIDYLTVGEYFRFIGKLHGKSDEDIRQFVDSMSDFFNGEITPNKKLIRDYSKGNQKKIGIAAALIGAPRVLILDEPFTALDPSSQIRLKRFLADLHEQRGVTMLISSHDLNHITEVSTRIVVLEKGVVVKDLQKNEDTLRELESYFAV